MDLESKRTRDLRRISNFPNELKERRIWSTWKYIQKPTGPTKVPTKPGGRNAKSNAPETWSTFEQVRAYYEKLNFLVPVRMSVFFEGNEGRHLIGVDLDGSVEDGVVAPWAEEIITRMNTYTEVSPSGTGVKLLAYTSSTWSHRNNIKIEVTSRTAKKPGIEVYDRLRFFALTGNIVGQYRTLRDCDDALAWLVDRYPELKRDVVESTYNSEYCDLTTTPEILDRARRFIDSKEPAISGQNGSSKLYEIAVSLVKGFALANHDAIQLIHERYNGRCLPPWSDSEIVHKVESASKASDEIGYLLQKQSSKRLDGDASMEITFGGKQSQSDEIANYIAKTIDAKDGSERRIKIPLSQPQLVENILNRFNGWPKRIGQNLFYCKGEKFEILKKPNDLFSWMRESVKVSWAAGESMVNREEIFASLLRHTEQFEDIQSYPHFPPIKDVYYRCRAPVPSDGGYLKKLLDFFSPSTAVDRELLLAAIVTPLWGGLAGQRPAFLFEAESRAGQGSGKSTAAQLISELVGGFLDVATKKIDAEEIKKRFLSSAAAQKRVAFLDNIKTGNFSDAGVESLMTTPRISGHQMYHGDATRPNLYTWFLTMNGPKLSRDFSQRCVSIVLRRPEHSSDWMVNVTRFVEENRDCIFDDVAGFFERPQQKLKSHSRWGVWEHAIVSRLADPNAVLKVIKDRADLNDVDAQIAGDIEKYIRKELVLYQYPDSEKVHIANSRMVGWVCNAIEENEGPRKTKLLLDRLENCGCFKFIKRNPCHKHGRGWLFGAIDGPTEPRYDLEELITKRLNG